MRSHLAHKWATLGQTAALERWGSRRRNGLRSHLAHKWATSETAFSSEAVVIPEAAGVASPPCPEVGHCWVCPPLRSGRAPGGGMGYVATLPISGPLLRLPPAPKR